MRFIKEKTTSSLNVRNMEKLRIMCSGLILVLLVSNLVLAALFLLKPVSAHNGISTAGEIAVYDSDGTTPLTGYDFPLFSGGLTDTFTKRFFIRNVGSDPVSVYWNITGSSISWELRAAPCLNVYDHYEEGFLKFSFGVTQGSTVPADYWHPSWEAILLGADEEVELGFELHYTGEPNTAEIFAMTVSFYAAQPSRVNAAVDVEPDTLNLKSKGKWISCFIELPPGYDVNDIRLDSIRLNDTIPVDPSAPVSVGDCDGDGISDLMVKFDRATVVQHIVSQGVEFANVTIILTGQLYDGTVFEGSDVIRVSGLVGDVNCDGKVSLFDMVLGAFALGSRPGSSRWNDNANFAQPWDIINLSDIVKIACNCGKKMSITHFL